MKLDSWSVYHLDSSVSFISLRKSHPFLKMQMMGTQVFSMSFSGSFLELTLRILFPSL